MVRQVYPLNFSFALNKKPNNKNIFYRELFFPCFLLPVSSGLKNVFLIQRQRQSLVGMEPIYFSIMEVKTVLINVATENKHSPV